MSVGRSVTHDWVPLARLVFNTQSESTALAYTAAAAYEPFFQLRKNTPAKHVTEMPSKELKLRKR